MWILYLWLSFANKIHVLKIVVVMCTVAGTMTTLKMMYHEPRPIFIFAEIRVYECAYEYGTPSGHCYGAIILYQMIFDALVFQRHQIQEQTDSFQYMYSNLQDLSENLSMKEKIK